MIFCLPAFLISCKQGKIQKSDDSIIIRTENSEMGTIKLQVINSDIIHVSASNKDTIPDFVSLMVEPSKQPFTDWTYETTDTGVVVKTQKIIAEVSVKTGEIKFADKEGKTKLKEVTGGGKSFTPAKANNGEIYEVQQVFDSPDDEAFYGLGQHQNGQMNYKNQDVELIQHNLVAVVPFLYSSKNYGILWDNYSITRFGDPREYQPLSSVQLFTKNDEPGGLTAKYFRNDKLILTRVEDTLDYQYLESAPNWPEGIDAGNVSKIVWEGSFSSPVKGKHKFRLYASEYFKLWIDDKLIFDKWRQNWNPWYNKFTVDVAGNEKHSLKIEWIPNGGYLSLEHLDPYPVEKQGKLSFYSEAADLIDYYFINGNSADEVISGYRTLTGKAPIMPEWAMGFWQSRERYKTQDELVNVVKEYRSKHIPLDNIVLDWFYWDEDKWGSHKFDQSRFPDAENMINTLHNDLHAHIMISVWPKFYQGTGNFKEMQSQGFLYQRMLETKWKDWVGDGYISTFYDAFNPGARELFWKQIDENLNSRGIDAWWLDASEPDVQSNHSIEERIRLMDPVYFGSGEQYFNAFSLMNSKGIYEGSRKKNPEKRVFILTRSAFGGQQRYASATWSGDVASRWSDLHDQIAAGINFCISGIPYWTHDIGGFSLENRYINPNAQNLEEWRELNTRWFQFGAFSPLFRSHGQFPYREIFNLAPESHDAYKSMVYYDKLRYRLMPYIYSLAGMTYHNDYTIMRALPMDFPNDKNVYDIDDEYMFGTSLLICPVYEFKARSRKVYLPKDCGWYDLQTGRYTGGGKYIDAAAPLIKMPVFAKEGSMVLLGPDIQYVDQKHADTITLYVYAGKNAGFTLYEDDGVTYNYEKGMYANIKIEYNNADNLLTINECKGDYPGMSREKLFRVVKVTPERPAGIDDSNVNYTDIRYKGEKITVLLN